MIDGSADTLQTLSRWLWSKCMLHKNYTVKSWHLQELPSGNWTGHFRPALSSLHRASAAVLLLPHADLLIAEWKQLYPHRRFCWGLGTSLCCTQELLCWWERAAKQHPRPAGYIYTLTGFSAGLPGRTHPWKFTVALSNGAARFGVPTEIYFTLSLFNQK